MKKYFEQVKEPIVYGASRRLAPSVDGRCLQCQL
jgi:hypothetical protein